MGSKVSLWHCTVMSRTLGFCLQPGLNQISTFSDSVYVAENTLPNPIEGCFFSSIRRIELFLRKSCCNLFGQISLWKKSNLTQQVLLLLKAHSRYDSPERPLKTSRAVQRCRAIVLRLRPRASRCGTLIAGHKEPAALRGQRSSRRPRWRRSQATVQGRGYDRSVAMSCRRRPSS